MINFASFWIVWNFFIFITTLLSIRNDNFFAIIDFNFSYSFTINLRSCNFYFWTICSSSCFFSGFNTFSVSGFNNFDCCCFTIWSSCGCSCRSFCYTINFLSASFVFRFWTIFIPFSCFVWTLSTFFTIFICFISCFICIVFNWW